MGDAANENTTAVKQDVPAEAQPVIPKEAVSSSFFVQELTAFYYGVMFFTRISVPKWVNHSHGFSKYWMSLSTVYYPAIGIIVGLFGSFFFCVAYYMLPHSPIIPAIAFTAATIRLTGGFHEDGLADMGDGFGGGWKRESVLRIMRDSAIGTFGALALILTLTTKIGAIVNLQQVIMLNPELISSGPAKFPLLYAHLHKLSQLVGTFVTAHAFGRWSCTYLLQKYKYVENASAAGKEFLLSVTPMRLAMASLMNFVIVGISLSTHENFVVQMIMVWVVAVWLTVYMGRYINRILGGVIGDCCGATNQIVECAMYLTLGVNWVRVFGDFATLYLMLREVVQGLIRG